MLSPKLNPDELQHEQSVRFSWAHTCKYTPHRPPWTPWLVNQALIRRLTSSCQLAAGWLSKLTNIASAMVSYRQQTGSSPGGSGNRIINPPALECLHGGRQHEETRFIHTRLLTLKKNVCFAGINLHERSEDCVDDRSFLPMVDTPTVTSNSVLDVRAVPSSRPSFARVIHAGEQVDCWVTRPWPCTVQVNVFRRGCRYFLLNLTQYFVWEC